MRRPRDLAQEPGLEGEELQRHRVRGEGEANAGARVGALFRDLHELRVRLERPEHVAVEGLLEERNRDVLPGDVRSREQAEELAEVRRRVLGPPMLGLTQLSNYLTLKVSFSAVSKPNFASKYALESYRRDLKNALLCTVL